MPKLKFIFFDVGRVLLDRFDEPLQTLAEHFSMSLEEATKIHCRSWTHQDLKQAWAAMRTVADQLEIGRIGAVAFLEEAGIGPTEADITFISNVWNKPTYLIKPDAISTLDLLAKKYRLGIISNAMPTRRHQELLDHDLVKYFDPIVISAEIGLRKPEAEIFHHALKLAGLTARESAMIDDRLDNIQTARKLGFARAILLDALGLWPGEEGRITSLSELPSLLLTNK